MEYGMRECRTNRTGRVPVVCGDVAYVPLSNGLITTVDAEDAPSVAAWSWSYVENVPGYPSAVAKVNRRMVSLSRFLMRPGPGLVVDHINGDRLDNRRVNLRVCTPMQNTYNRKKPKGVNPYIGVVRHPQTGRWMAYIRAGGRRYHIGYFSTPEEAAIARDARAILLHGEFAKLNFQV